MSRQRDLGIAKISAAGLVSVLILLVAGLFITQKRVSGQPDVPDSGEYRISVNVGLVVLPVVVTDRKGSAVTGLGADNFRVFEDGRPQHIAFFEPQDVPVMVGLVVDNSASMAEKRPEVLAAAELFAKSSNPQDQMFVVNFNDTASLGLPQGLSFTSDVQQLQSAISRQPPAGNTALYDGIGAALQHLRAGSAQRKALIVISDGGDNSSQLGLRQLLKRAQASNAEIYTLGVFDEHFTKEHPEVLRRLAKVSGGKSYFPTSPSQIPVICQQIALDLRYQYTLGYRPSMPGSGGTYHAIRVMVAAAHSGRLHVFTRRGYRMPSEPVAEGSKPIPHAKASS